MSYWITIDALHASGSLNVSVFSTDLTIIRDLMLERSIIDAFLCYSGIIIMNPTLDQLSSFLLNKAS